MAMSIDFIHMWMYVHARLVGQLKRNTPDGKSHPVSTFDFLVLETIHEGERGASVGVLRTALKLNHYEMSKALSRLKKHGLVQCQRDEVPASRRNKYVTLTETGKNFRDLIEHRLDREFRTRLGKQFPITVKNARLMLERVIEVLPRMRVIRSPLLPDAEMKAMIAAE